MWIQRLCGDRKVFALREMGMDRVSSPDHLNVEGDYQDVAKHTFTQQVNRGVRRVPQTRQCIWKLGI